MTNGRIFLVCSTSGISALCFAKNFSFFSCTERMAKRMQEKSEENRIVAKSRPTAMNLTSSVATNSSPVNSPIASRSPVILKASSRQVGLSGRPDANTDSILTERRVPKDGKGMLNCSSAPKNLWQLNTKDVQKILKFQKTQNQKVEFGHIISVYHQTVYLTERPCLAVRGCVV